ncbi:hypothetical protein P171DRAFT_470386 [Karstenula rhodostoma CBS 690.94]|uniref:Uncharacterized protein n=1 Tax=Karstenula rhodostoma CBS 690.94 TaxID=1392251 RepID=A0A9P4PSS5_9PLEO|nr:hypothetical protein P171DRAFT_470386 [Karstenula rhodostoma CBS 690.94]
MRRGALTWGRLGGWRGEAAAQLTAGGVGPAQLQALMGRAGQGRAGRSRAGQDSGSRGQMEGLRVRTTRQERCRRRFPINTTDSSVVNPPTTPTYVPVCTNGAWWTAQLSSGAHRSVDPAKHAVSCCSHATALPLHLTTTRGPMQLPGCFPCTDQRPAVAPLLHLIYPLPRPACSCQGAFDNAPRCCATEPSAACTRAEMPTVGTCRANGVMPLVFCNNVDMAWLRMMQAHDKASSPGEGVWRVGQDDVHSGHQDFPVTCRVKPIRELF